MSATMASGSYVFGAVVRLMLDGTTHGASGTGATASSSVQPLTTDTPWITLPSCDKLEMTIEKEFRDVNTVNSGHRVRSARHHVSTKRTLKGTFNNIDVRILQLAFGMASPDGTDESFTVGGGTDKMAWVEAKMYDSTNTLQFTYTAWCRVAVVDSLTFDDNVVNVSIEFAEVHNSLNKILTI